ncbi:MAG: hypothetical protein Q8941_05915 [Bacteroidota bacterium]|nr:hypothetical protein [Bacteroidota bacterium]
MQDYDYEREAVVVCGWNAWVMHVECGLSAISMLAQRYPNATCTLPKRGLNTGGMLSKRYLDAIQTQGKRRSNTVILLPSGFHLASI